LIFSLELDFRKSSPGVEESDSEGETEDFYKVPEFAGIFIDFCFEIWYKGYCRLTPAVFV